MLIKNCDETVVASSANQSPQDVDLTESCTNCVSRASQEEEEDEEEEGATRCSQHSLNHPKHANSETSNSEQSQCNSLSSAAYSDDASIGQPLRPPSPSSPPPQPHVEKSSLETKTNSRRQLESSSDTVTIIHFNDCYNIEPGPESSGAAGFLTAINQFKHLNPMILFSGDIISPSFMSTFTKGEQMIPVLNDIGVDCAVFGNHEFDYGVENLVRFTEKTSFPWLLSNVIDKETSNQLGEGKVFHIIERSNLKFGLIGLIEEEWLSTLSTLDSSDVIYHDFVEKGRELARWLKGEPHNVDYVIALTHFRTPNDIKLADSVPEIDLILGGHDHEYEIIKRPNCDIVKSGTDFREFSKISLKLNAQYSNLKRQQQQQQHNNSNDIVSASIVKLDNDESGETSENKTAQQQPRNNNRETLETLPAPIVSTEIERINCAPYPPDENLRQKLEKFVTTIDEKMGQVLGQFNCELDGRFSKIRNYETNLGNFVTDIMLASTHADLAILNSGTLRSDRIHPKGDFTMRDLFNILGYIDPIAVLQASGYHIWQALENGVSQWPKLEGRFPQVSGCTFAFDPKKPPLHRIDPNDVTIGEEPLILDKQYKLTTKAYLASGKDGYDVLKNCKILVPGDESPDLTTSILNHFEAINIVKSNRRTHHRQSIICLSRSSIKKLLDQETSSVTSEGDTSSNNQSDKNNNNCDDATVANCNVDSPGNNKLELAGNSAPLAASSSSAAAAAASLVSPGAAASPLVGTPTSLETLVESDAGQQLSSAEPVTPMLIARRAARTKRLMSLNEMEHEQCKLEPKIEGRIRILGANV